MSVPNHQGDPITSLGPCDIEVRAAYALQQQGAQLVDVREPLEFAQGHAMGAINIPLGQLGTRINELDLDRTVLLICRSGSRSRSAQDLLARRKISDTRNVVGGTGAWRLAGLPVE